MSVTLMSRLLPRGFDPLGRFVSHLPPYEAAGSLRVRARMFEGFRPRLEGIPEGDRRRDTPQYFRPLRDRTQWRGPVGVVSSDQDVALVVVSHAGELDRCV